ncbi:hypothetical protein M0R45_004275 [Rubus argutus]|uniref:Hexosyltransferase n=1 Tax=Rubus argutus TaxID=59490 RepID=A0AAW1YJB5_RUBAR
MPIQSPPSLVKLLSFLFFFLTTTNATAAATTQPFKEAPKFYNSESCPSLGNDNTVCSDVAVHVAMTLDAAYLRGSMAAILSVLQHSSCPENVFFHFVAAASSSNSLLLSQTLSSSFPYLKFRVYPFGDSAVAGLISTSIRSALDCPLNYARNYLANLLPPCVRRVVYLDSDLVLVDDIAKLAATPLGPHAVLAAPEYCNANFTTYFTPSFWANPTLSLTFEGRDACYFNTGVMVIDLDRWRAGGYTSRIVEWMELQKRMRIYELGGPYLHFSWFSPETSRPWTTVGTNTVWAATTSAGCAGICTQVRSACSIGATPFALES